MIGPVIILAPPRSYTSIICGMIGQHPQLYGLPELNLFVAETIRERAGILKQWRFAEHGLLRVIAQLNAGEQTVQTISLARAWLEARADSTYISVFNELVMKMARKIPIDKSPITAWRAEYMQRVRRTFPEARFIHLLRHPRSQGESLWELGGVIAGLRLDAFDYSTEPPILDFQKVWFTMHMNIITFLDGLPEHRKIRIRGEDVLAKPDVQLTRIASWLGLSTDTKSIEAMKHPERSPYACFGPPNATFGNDPNFLRSPALHNGTKIKKQSLEGPLRWRRDGGEFSDEVRELAVEFGYE